ncbi:MAG: glycosyltransferase [Chloroflexaceae bacterium]|nr:glycosyltransferase [Chloroflexaceae bacterium]
MNQRATCIVTPSEDFYSETFIRAHVERLPRPVRVLQRRWVPFYVRDARHLPSTIRKVAAGLCRLFRASPQAIHFQVALRFLQVHRVRVVLAEYGPIGASMLEVCERAGVPLIVHFHGYDAYVQAVLEEHHEVYQRMFAAARGIIAVSRDMEARLRSLGAPRDRLYYNPYGIDPYLFTSANPASNPPVFVTVGRFVEKKGPHKTLYAFRKVLDACPDARLVMIGGGKLWGACQHLAQALNVADHVTFAGPRSHPEVAATMRSARAFVQHSLRASNGDSEGTPVAVLEAGMTGLPVVATRHAGIKDVVRHEATGFLVDEGDIDGMAEAMIRLARDAALAADLGRQAREHVQHHFSMDRSIATLARILEEAARP